MKRADHQLSVYLKGDALDPIAITSLLGVEATKSHAKGKRWLTSNDKEVVERTGLWALVLQADSGEEFSELIARMKVTLGRRSTPLDRLPGLQEAYLDVLAMIDADEDGGGTCEFDIDKLSIAALGTFGLPVKFTIAVVVQ